MTDSAEPEFRGACHCGAVRYHCSGAPTFQFLCHCDNCRRLNGGMRLTGMSFSSSQLTVEGATVSYTFAGGKGPICNHFCGTCGTSVFAYPQAYPGIVVVRANTLDDESAFQPEKSVYTRGLCAWDRRVAPPTWRPPLAEPE